MTTEVVPADPGHRPATGTIGEALRRTDGAQLLTGRARYVDDFAPPGMLHLHVVRSPVARARIVSVDVAEARRAPGVVTAFAGEEAAQRTAPIPYFIDPVARGGKNVEIRCLAVGSVVHAGQAVAAVVAGSRAEAEAAGELVRLELEAEEPVLDARAALGRTRRGSTPTGPTTSCCTSCTARATSTRPSAAADVVVHETLTIARQTTSPDRDAWLRRVMGRGRRAADRPRLVPEPAPAALDAVAEPGPATRTASGW